MDVSIERRKLISSGYNATQLMGRSVVADICVVGSIYRLNALKQGAVGKIGALCSNKHADAK